MHGTYECISMIISLVWIINIIHELQEVLLTTIEEENKSVISEEIGENLFIFITRFHKYISPLSEWSVVMDGVKNISKMKGNMKPSLKNKCIFKHMDIMDAVKKLESKHVKKFGK